eukprot:COSAG04_NODE_5048_length_1764_cov_1.507508_2_plen_59_part_00
MDFNSLPTNMMEAPATVRPVLVECAARGRGRSSLASGLATSACGGPGGAPLLVQVHRR